MASMSMSSCSTSSAVKESLLLNHTEKTDEWAGWCTVESEPVLHSVFRIANSKAIFNQLLWDIGVSQAQVHEIYTLDLESFTSIK
jgi:hypothetical protein